MAEKFDKLIAQNKKAYHDYTIIESFEAGINLIGCEVKSLRMHEANLKDGFAIIKGGTVILKQCYIKVYDKGSFSNVDSRRERRLLLHASETRRLNAKVKEKGYSIVPLKMYFSKSLVKVEIALVKGKKQYDKRDDIIKKELDREIERAKAGNF